MDISEALFHVRNGNFARRVSWSDPNKFIGWFDVPQGYLSETLVRLASFPVLFTRGTGELDIFDRADGYALPWLATIEDYLADDWEFLSLEQLQSLPEADDNAGIPAASVEASR